MSDTATLQAPRPPNRRRRRLLVGVLCAVVLADSIAYAYKLSEGRSAFLRWQPQLVELAAGVNIFRVHAFPAPPITALALYPLATLPPLLGAMIFYFIKVALAGVAVFWALRLARGREPPIADWAVGLVVLLSLRSLLEDLQHGNVNIVVSTTLVGALYAFSRGRDVVAGLVLGLATALKLTPGLFIPYFIYRRQWRVVASSGAGLLLFLGVFPSLALGWSFNVECLVAWFDTMVRPYATNGVVQATSQLNQSLAGITHRLLTDTPGLRLYGETLRVNIVALDPETAQWIVRVSSVALLAWLAWICRGPLPDRRNWRWACEFGLVAIAMTVLSERAWKAHYAVMILPYSVLVTQLVTRSIGPRLRRILIGALATSFTLMLCTSRELAGWLYWWEGRRAAHKFAEAYGMYALSAVVVFAALSMLLSRTHQRGVARFS